MRDYTVIGVTGPTGAGKTTVTKYFESKGCHIIDADELGRQSLAKGSDCLKQVCTVFGDDILNSDGILNRQLLAKRAFSTEENTKRLNNITHPWICMRVLERIDDIRNTETNPIIIFDAAVLIESHMDIICDIIISVIAPVDVRRERIMKRDNLTFENAEIRINAQKSDDFYRKRADFMLNGSDDIAKLQCQMDKILVHCGRR